MSDAGINGWLLLATGLSWNEETQDVGYAQWLAATYGENPLTLSKRLNA